MRKIYNKIESIAGNVITVKAEGIKYLQKDRKKKLGISNDKSTVAWNHNSGYAAISLAYHLGVKKIILLGFDMNMGDVHGIKKDISHWHGSHGNRKPPPFKRHMRGSEKIKKDAKKFGIKIINASPDSAIEEFPKMHPGELL